MKNSIVNIESANNNSFGTGFVIDKDDKGIYILTCQHVIEDVGIPIVENVLARVTVLGGFLDMAVIYVPKLNLEPLPLAEQQNTNSDVMVIGFSRFNHKIIQKQHIEATLYKESIELHSSENDSFYNVRKIKAKEGFTFNRGNSGSPVICQISRKVIAMISNKEGNSLAYAINIENLKDVWTDIPKNILDIKKLKVSNNTPLSLISKTDKKEYSPLNNYNNVTNKEKKKIPTFLKYFLGIGLALFFIVYYTDKEAEKWNNKGVKSYQAQRFDEAIKYYKEAIDWDSDYALAYNNLSLVYLEKGQYALALDATKTALTKVNDNDNLKSSIYYNRGFIFERQSLSSEALKNYELANSYINKKEYKLKIEKIIKEKNTQKNINNIEVKSNKNINAVLGDIISNISKVAEGEHLYKKCAGCHGLYGNNRALGKSKVIGGKSKEELIRVLTMYKMGKLNQYGMGSIMKGQVMALSNVDIQNISLYLSGLK